VISDPCSECHGQGRTERRRSIEVRIPPGVDTGTRLRLQGEGEYGRRGGPQGDLFVDIRVRPHQQFERRGADVLSEVPTTFSQAVLGGQIELETLHGPESIDIPPGTQEGSDFRLRGKGIQRLDGAGRGDHIAVARLVVPHPRDLDEDRVELLRRLAELDGVEVREGRKVLDRVRDLFG
jgi:molecular chaperone DnaJ